MGSASTAPSTNHFRQPVSIPATLIGGAVTEVRHNNHQPADVYSNAAEFWAWFIGSPLTLAAGTLIPASPAMTV